MAASSLRLSLRLIVAMLLVTVGAETGLRAAQAEPAVAVPVHGSGTDARVTLKPLTMTLTSDVQAEQSPVITIRATRSGILNELTVTQGDTVSAGQVIGHLSGPEITLALRQAQLAVKAAQAAVKTNQSLLTLARQRADAHFGSRQEVYQATLARDEARVRLADSRAVLQQLQTQHDLRATTDGVISATPSVTGDAVRSGDAVVSIQPDKALWLEGQFFGGDRGAVRQGQTGVFTPSDGSAPLTVSVVSLLSEQNGLTVRFRPVESNASDSSLYAGETGKIDIQVVRAPQPAVPSEALILDQGRWWVMLEDDSGVHAQAVDPIAHHDGWTWLQGKIRPGDRVRLRDAYLSFHQSFSTRYQQPD